jgi:hypothetical protein
MRRLFYVFFAMGFGFASWAARIPQGRDELHLRPHALGLLLIAIAAGSLVSLPLGLLGVGVRSPSWRSSVVWASLRQV